MPTPEEKATITTQWNHDTVRGIIELLTAGRFYGNLNFIFVNGSIVSAQTGQHIKFPASEKPLIIQGTK